MNFVLVHGAWHGGWCWRDVARHLRDEGHQVFTPTLTGLGERAHLLTESVGLSTFVEDICAVIEYEELTEVVLVGHSFGGPVISGVADKYKENIRHLIYLDALIVQDGQSAMSILPPEVQTARSRTIDAKGLKMAVPSPEQFGVFEPAQAAWVTRRTTPHPLRAYTEPLSLHAPLGNGLPKTYIAVTAPWYAPLENLREWIRCQADWNWQEIAAGHDAMVTSPHILATMLIDIATKTGECETKQIK